MTDDGSPVSGFRHLGDRLIHRGYIWDLVEASFESPDGERFQRDIVRSPGAVGAVPVYVDSAGQARVVLVSQYRPPFDDVVIEIPAGIRDVVDEPTDETARRELIEEVGLSAASIEPLVQFFPSAGMTDSVLHLFCASDLTPVARDLHGPEEAHMDVLDVSVDEAIEMVLSCAIRDAKTTIGLLLVDRRLRAGWQPPPLRADRAAGA